jgi:hypothetical protein
MRAMAGRILTIATALLALALTDSALAEEQATRDAFAAVSVIDAADLDGLRGREGGQQVIVATDQELTASVIGGSITAHEVTTGGVTFGEGALDGFGGIGVFNVVTGNNNSVQAAVGVTFNLLE